MLTDEQVPALVELVLDDDERHELDAKLEAIRDEDGARGEDIGELTEQVLLFWWEQLPRHCRRVRKATIGARARRRVLRAGTTGR
jgi:hypothetical protein